MAQNTLIIDGGVFTEATVSKVVGKPVARFISKQADAGSLSFSAALVAEFPALEKTDRVRVFHGGGLKLAIVPAAKGEGTSMLRDGKGAPRRKIQGKLLAPLFSYERIEYRVKAIPGREGWLLTPITSDRKA